ncbi:hypothetical protein [Sphingomonas profundi]|uniref:hypothetical protein n=1 Tax=Alterirhizorhabdus profundi TaxID=2681549 RepID=UPI0012E72E89|nr:hypothetical protein [Sphingomonas profundi]
MRRRGGRALLAIAAATVAAPTLSRAPPPPTGTLTLDMDAPVISIMIGSVPLRLRVDFDQRDAIELNAAAADRLGLPFERGSTDDVGRIAVPSRVATATFVLNDRTMMATLSTHGDCCAGVDGAISPALLPYALVRLVRAADPARPALSFAMERDGDFGLQARQRVGREAVRVKLSLVRNETLATASAGAILAAAHGGRFAGGTQAVPVMFGIARPARPIAFDRPPVLAGFRFDWLLVRTADFGGRRQLPQEAGGTDDIVVRRRVPRQIDWPAIVIGRDRLDRCGEIAFSPLTLTMTLRCDFAG